MRYMNKFGLSNYDAEILTSERKLSEFYDDCISRHHNPKSIANWIINEVLRSSKNSSDTEEITEFNTKISSSNLAEIIKLIDEKIISNNIAKKVFAVLETNPEESPIKIIEENNWKVVSNSGEIESFVEQILRDNPTEVQKYRDGKKQVFGFLMGQLMKISKGQLDPETANKLLLAYLNKNS